MAKIIFPKVSGRIGKDATTQTLAPAIVALKEDPVRQLKPLGSLLGPRMTDDALVAIKRVRFDGEKIGLVMLKVQNWVIF
jgi:hypothetical protein